MLFKVQVFAYVENFMEKYKKKNKKICPCRR